MRNIVFLSIVLLFPAGCTVSGVDVEQEQASGLAGELLDGGSFGQTFTLQYDGLYRIDLYTATYARENTHQVIFRICPSPACGQGEGADLVRLEISAAEISNYGPTIITFPPLHGVAGETLYFSIEAPGSIPGDATTVYRHDKDVYPGGQMFIDGRPAEGDIAFIAYTQETFTPAAIWHDFYSRASQDKPFFTFYCFLLTLILLALIVTRAWPRRKPGRGETSDDGCGAIGKPVGQSNPISPHEPQ